MYENAPKRSRIILLGKKIGLSISQKRFVPKKVPIKIKKCAALHSLLKKKVAGFKVIKNQSYSHLYVKIVTVDRLMQIVNATVLSTMCKYFKMYNNFVLSSTANSTNTKSIQLNCTV